MAKPRALVIGGSIGGLFAANALHKIGWDVTVFERAENDLASRGAGIGTHGELVQVLNRLGIPIDETLGLEIRTRICLDRGGRVIHELELPQRQSSWARIYRLLKDAFPSEQYRFGMNLASIAQDAASVTALFADGSRATGDLLVAADGVRSIVRELFLPGIQPRYAGYIAWRGMLEERDIPPAAHAQLFERYTMCLPEGELMLAYPVPGRNGEVHPGHRGYNHIWYRPTDERETLPLLCTDASGHCHGTSIPPPLIRPALVEEIKAIARTVLAPQIAAIMERTRQMFFQAIFDVESPQLALGRVVLLGDAAFVARPHAGMGVTKAAFDALCLADAITAAEGDLGAALARYDRERSYFGRGLVARARRLGAYLEAQTGPPAERAKLAHQHRPEVAMREIGPAALNLSELSYREPGAPA